MKTSDYRPHILGSVCLIGITLIAYANVLRCDFVSFDDPDYVAKNVHVLKGLSPDGIAYAWTTFDCANWHPMTWLSLELDGTLFGANPAGYHASNLAWHISNVVLLFWVLRRMTNSFWRSLVVSVLFAVHPLHVESVAWVSERKDVLSTFCLLLTLAAYERYATRPGLVRYALVAFAMALGLLAKPMLVSLPFLLLLLDYWPLRRLTVGKDRIRTADQVDGEMVAQPYPPVLLRRLVCEKIPLLVLAIVSGVITIVAQTQGGAVETLAKLPLGARIANAVHACAWYLAKTVWPTGLTVFYPHPLQSLTVMVTVGSVLLLLAISCVVLRAARSQPYLIVGWLWFLVALAPVIGVLQVGGQAYADRYAYVPHIGLFVLLVFGASDWLNRQRVRYRFSLILAVLLVAACTVRTTDQVAYWHDTESLMTHAVDVVDGNWMAHEHLGGLRLHQGRPAAAETHFEAVLRIWPNSTDAHCNLGKALVDQGRFDEAERHYEASLKSDPRNHKAHFGLGLMYKNQQRWQEADRCFAEVVRLHPEHWRAHYQRGLSLLEMKMPEEAAAQFLAVTRINPSFVAAHCRLASALTQGGRPNDAMPHLVQALQINPNSADAHYLMGTILEDERNFDRAKESYAQVLRIRPGHAEAADRLRRLPNSL